MAGFEASKLETLIVEKMGRYSMPGLSIALVSGGEVVYSRGFGFRDLESGLPATPRTLYCVGSVTKSFTALAIAKLAYEGRISLEDPVSRYVPLDLRPVGGEVRIEHLLTHTSGIPALGYAEAFIRGALEGGPWLPAATYDDVIAFMRGSEGWAETKPGEKFFYLNEGYVLLGYVIERASGVRYEDYVKREILDPLEMRRSYFSREEVESDEDWARPYLIDPRERRPVPSRYPYGLNPDGGLVSNALDLSNYIAMYLGRGRFRGRQVFPREVVEDVERPRIRVGEGPLGEEYYGYGWMVIPDFLGERLICHSGSVLVSTAFVGYVPGRGLGVAVLANSSGYPTSFIGMYALALAMGKDPEGLPFIKLDRALDRYSGTYETYMGTVRASVSRVGDAFELKMGGRYSEMRVHMLPVEVGDGHAVFETVLAGRRVRAEFREKDGAVELLFERYKMRKVG